MTAAINLSCEPTPSMWTAAAVIPPGGGDLLAEDGSNLLAEDGSTLTAE